MMFDTYFHIGEAIGRALPAQANSPTIRKFNSMVGIPDGLTGTKNQTPLHGINGGGLPWELTSASGSLSSDGKLKVEVTGLVLSSGPNAAAIPSPASAPW